MPKRVKFLVSFSMALVVFTGYLWSRDIVTSHEGRVAQVAREMHTAGWPWQARSSVHPVLITPTPNGKRLLPDLKQSTFVVNPWLLPTLDHELRLQKSPLPYWCAAIAYWFFDVSELGARLIPALLGALATFIVSALARDLLGRRAGWIAGLVWVSSYFIIDEFRKAMADPYLAFFALLAVLAWVRAGKRARTRAGGWILLFYASMGIGMLAKGPVLLLHVTVPLVLYHVLYRARTGGGWWHLAGGVIFAAIAAPWPWYVLTHVPHAWEMWWYESAGEVTRENVEKPRPFYSYFPTLPQITLPWIGFWLTGIVFALQRALGPRRRHRVLLPLLWCLLLLVIFSALPVKKAAYLLPVMAAQVLLVTQGTLAVLGLLRLARWKRFKQRRARWPSFVVQLQRAIGVAFGLFVAAAVIVQLEWLPKKGQIISTLSSRLHEATAWHFALAAVALIFADIPIRRKIRGHPHRWFAVQAISYALHLYLFCNFVATPWSNARSVKSIAKKTVETAAQSNFGISRTHLDEDALFYLPLRGHEPQRTNFYVLVREKNVGKLDYLHVDWNQNDLRDETPLGISPANPWRRLAVIPKPTTTPTTTAATQPTIAK